MVDDDKVLAVPADIVDAGHGERNVASVREPRVRLQLQPFRACGTAADVVWTRRADGAY